MPATFSGNGTVAAGNATGLLAISNVVYAGNVTPRANGTGPIAWFTESVTITPSDPANFTVVAAANAVHAANIPAGYGLKCTAGGTLVIPPGWVINSLMQGNTAGYLPSQADAGNIYVATSANQTYTLAGV